MEDNREQIWQAFLKTGKPGYYMLYQALRDKEEKER